MRSDASSTAVLPVALSEAQPQHPEVGRSSDGVTTAAVSNSPPRQAKFSFWVGVAFTLNYVIGSGFLTIPWAFQQTGPALGVLVLFTFGFFAVLAVLFLLETTDRAERVFLAGRELELRRTSKGKRTYLSLRDRSDEFSSDEDSDDDEKGSAATVTATSSERKPTAVAVDTSSLRASESDNFSRKGSSGLDVEMIVERNQPVVSKQEQTFQNSGDSSSNSNSGIIRNYNSNINSSNRNNSNNNSNSSNISRSTQTFRLLQLRRNSSIGREMKLLDAGENRQSFVDRGVFNDPQLLAFANRRFEIVELCDMFLGPWGRSIFSLCIVVYMYGTLWAYCTVFARSFAANVSLGSQSYNLYLLLFACLVCPFSLMELTEQVAVQVTLAVLRIVMVSVMIATTVAAYLTNSRDFGSIPELGNDPVENAARFHLGKIYLLLPIAAYAYIFHHSVPALSEPMKDRSSLGRMFSAALLIAFVSYSLLGFCVCAYFGANTQQSSNLNWESFKGLQPHGTTPYYAWVISFFVVLFPAVDVASAYPLNAFTLGNTLMSSYYGKDTVKHEKSRFKTSVFRMLAALPPFFGALLVSDLGSITGYTGLTGFLLAFIFPPLLARFSADKITRFGMPASTKFSSYWTTAVFQNVLCSSGAVLIVVVTACMILLPQ